LRRLRAIRHVGVEGESQQRMIEEHSVRCPNRGLAVLKRIPRNSEAGSQIVEVPWNALRDSKRVLRCSRYGITGSRSRRELNVVARAVVQSKIWLDPPRVLQEETQRVIGETGVRIANALDEALRNPKPICLHRREVRNVGPQKGRWKPE